jgi:hypothetical protein
MPAIFDQLYFEYCRARLAEMRKQLLITGKSPEVLLTDCDAADGGASAGQTHSTKSIAARRSETDPNGGTR